MPEAYQQEFEKLTEGSGEGAAPSEAQAKATEEAIELMLNGQKLAIPLTTEIPFKHNGTIQKLPFSQLLNNYRQADHLTSKVSELQNLKKSLEQERGDLDTYKNLRAKYEMIQKWSEENEDQWNRLYDMWQQKERILAGQATDPNQAAITPYLKEIDGLNAKLRKVEEFMNTYEQQTKETEVQKQMSQVQKEIDAFAKDFPEIPLDEKDQSGITVREHIIAFGVENGIPEFEAAALKYLKPRLLETIQARARNEAVKGVRGERKEGILARSSKPFQSGQSSIDPRKMSYEDLKNLAREEFEAQMKT